VAVDLLQRLLTFDPARCGAVGGVGLVWLGLGWFFGGWVGLVPFGWGLLGLRCA